MCAKRRLKKIVLFAGPSLPSGIDVDVEMRSPARRGDFARLADDPESLVIFADGCFFSEAAPTHYELLHYLSKQQLMIGTASMGALRAAELARYGLRGVGTVFHAVVSGLIKDDAELAVAMDPFTFAALTVPAVNVRRLLELLRKTGVEEMVLSRAWKSAQNIYFMDRTFERMIDQWKRDGLSGLVDSPVVERAHDPMAYDVKKHDVVLALNYAASLVGSGTKADDVKTSVLGLYHG